GQAGGPGSAGATAATGSGGSGSPDAGAGGQPGTGGGGPGGQAGQVTSPDGGVTAFPLSYSSDRRYLQDAHGTPFPILGRTAWNVVSLLVSDANLFLADTLSKGYDAIELAAIWRDSRAANIPFDGAGDAPFLKTLGGSAWNGNLTYKNINTDGPDFSTPNPAYWNFVAQFVDQCAANGIAVLMFPAYVGFNGEESEGWMGEMTANGSARMQAYGAYLGNLFATRGNVIWMAGGDYGTDTNQFTSAQLAVESALLSGVRSVSGASTFWSAEWTSESNAVDQPNFGSSMTLNGAYSWAGATIIQGRRAYAHTPAEPAFLLEEPYDEEGADGNDVNPNATQPVRRFQWWGWLSTIGGYMSGNGYIWPFTPGVWQQHLNTQGARDMANLNAFVRSIAWQQLIPDGFGAKDLVTAGIGSEDDLGRSTMVTAAANPAGTLLVAYVPPAHTGSFTIDMTNMSGQTTARWLNPSTGAYTAIGTFPNTGKQTFTVPGNNGTGFTDWTLVLTVP
ncbi:MAG TPA: DUF4038 domain-containing protein, partial [Polyangia bacterium]|nr:DUF4038 domain-containing protein [Polyangia bacterium]